MLYGVKHSEVMLDRINAVSFKNGLVLGEIHIEDGASTRIITSVSKTSTKPFVDAVHKAIELKKKNEYIPVSGISNADEIQERDRNGVKVINLTKVELVAFLL